MSHHRRDVCLFEKEGDGDPPPPPPSRDLIATSNSRSITPNVAVRPPSLSLEESIHCFRAISYRRPPPSSQNQRRPKARLTEAEKTKVLGVRRQGACLRCRMLKIECSLQNPCQPCLQSAVKGTERKVLSFSYCVRTRFADVNIFLDPCSATPAFKMRTETLMLKMSNLLSRIAMPAQFSFLEDKAAFNKTMTSWLSDPNFGLGGGSMVGLCCSNLLALRFAEGEGEGEKDLREVGKEFQQFLLATSLAHTRSGSAKGMNPLEVGLAGQVSGSRLLLRLDRILTPQYLAKLSRSSCQVLFLFVLGAVLGVGYSTSSAAVMQMQSPDFPAEMLDEQLQQSPTLWLAMREHLCQMLAHHLIYLGGMLGIKLETGMERRIIECAGKGWGKTLGSTTPAAPQKQHYDWEGGYVWGDGIIPETDNQGQEEGGLSGEQEHGRTGEEDNLNPKYWDDDAEMTDNNTTTPVPQPSEPPPPPLVPIACGPELSHFKNYEHNCDWDQNPASYLEMSEPETYYTPIPASQAVAGEKRAFPSVSRAPTERYFRSQEYDIPRERKRRTMWIVRSVDAGPEAGHINVHARLRGGRDLEGLRSFV